MVHGWLGEVNCCTFRFEVLSYSKRGLTGMKNLQEFLMSAAEIKLNYTQSSDLQKE